ncbi:hypothetical protein PV05_03591 [Exophiala xenobiotica]|uniref:Uncharacterized protein n=1 Tax=Exophiala xenobiotica TaxID=348802 RepID=A0A0D2C2S1_9EURO|nr:uncharacterized protein PV05_03591 [Exophiala xenobiotica]KIW59116.1 hypothetical protein PV05_03591 [Exophiala xenobiotica]
MEPTRMTVVRVRVAQIRPETLDYFRYPWEWDKDRNFIIIKRSCTQNEIDALSQHTRDVLLVSRRVTISKPVVKRTTTVATLRSVDTGTVW